MGVSTSSDYPHIRFTTSDFDVIASMAPNTGLVLQQCLPASSNDQQTLAAFSYPRTLWRTMLL
jgi:hypothetical protein